jgi:hypothetical protein
MQCASYHRTYEDFGAKTHACMRPSKHHTPHMLAARGHAGHQADHDTVPGTAQFVLRAAGAVHTTLSIRILQAVAHQLQGCWVCACIRALQDHTPSKHQTLCAVSLRQAYMLAASCVTHSPKCSKRLPAAGINMQASALCSLGNVHEQITLETAPAAHYNSSPHKHAISVLTYNHPATPAICTHICTPGTHDSRPASDQPQSQT